MSAKIKRRHHKPPPGMDKYQWEHVKYYRWHPSYRYRADPNRLGSNRCLACGSLIAGKNWGSLATPHTCIKVSGFYKKYRRNDKNRRKVR